jgi:hypothetical protein
MIVDAGQHPGVDYPVGASIPTPAPVPPSNSRDDSAVFVFSSMPGAIVMGRTNYLGMGGYWAPSAYSQYAGLFTYKSKNSLGSVPDGTSNTMMFGEYAGGWITWGGSGGIPDGIAGAAWACGYNYTGTGAPVGADKVLANDSAGKIQAWAKFSSLHTGGVIQVGMADGSVQRINTSIDFTTWVVLSGYKDGVVVTLP